MFKISAQEVIDAAKICRKFIPENQLETMSRNMRNRDEGDWFRSKFLELAALVLTMPKTYEQDGLGDQSIAYLHYFSGDSDWYIIEKDMEDEQHQAFGYADAGYGELGYISLVELCKHPSVELDLHWTPKPLSQIRQAA